MKQKIKGKNCTVFYFAGKRIFQIYIYEVIIWEKIHKRARLYYCGHTRSAAARSCSASCSSADDDVFYLFLQKQKIGAELHIYLEQGTYHKRLFRGPNTNDMKK